MNLASPSASAVMAALQGSRAHAFLSSEIRRSFAASSCLCAPPSDRLLPLQMQASDSIAPDLEQHAQFCSEVTLPPRFQHVVSPSNGNARNDAICTLRQNPFTYLRQVRRSIRLSKTVSQTVSGLHFETAQYS